MRCEEITLRLPDYLAGTLNDAERDAVEQHQAGCPACQQESAGLSAMWRLLGDIPVKQPDSRAMRARIDAMLDREQSAQPDPLQHRPARRAFQWNPLLTACAASVLLAVGILLGRATDSRPSAVSEAAELHAELRDLRKMVTLSLMQQQSASERLRGVSFSNQADGAGDEIVTALLDTLGHDTNVNVRLASIDALKRFAERDVVRHATIDALGTQNSPLVQMALIDFVVETQDRAALATLRRLSADPAANQTVRTRAAWGIEHLGVQS